MFVLHGAAESPCTGRTLAALFLMDQVEGKDFKFVRVTEFSQIKSPEWLENQPFGQMPYLEDTENGFVIYESRAIVKYIAAKVASPLLPTPSHLIAYGNFEKACSIETSDFDPHAHHIAFELIYAKMRGLEPDLANVEKHATILASRLDVYEKILSKQKYLAGDILTIADTFHLTYGDMVVNLGKAPALLDAEGHPNLARWWKELTSLPGWLAYQDLLKPKN